MRDAAVADAHAILDVRTSSWRVAYAHVFDPEALGSMSVDPWLDWWRDVIAIPPAHMHTVVVERSGDVVGFCQVGAGRSEPRDTGELHAMYVRPDAWGCGVGRTLMREALGRLRREAFAEAILWVLDDNPRTRRFYELAGWRADGGKKDEVWLGTRIHEVRYRITL